MNYYLRILILLSAIFIFSECRTRNVSMNAMRPAEITFPSHINTLLIVDRTEFDNKILGIIESILTGELPEEDKAGAQETMTTFQNTLGNSPRFNVIRASERLKGNSITSAFPDPIAWSEIERLCRKYNSDALIAIEIYNSNFIITHGTRKLEKEVEVDGEKKTIEVDGFYAEGIASVKIGFRIYDPTSKSIMDQELFTRNSTWDASGTSLQEALSTLVAKQEATRQVARQIAGNYAHKIAPMPMRITRQFYSRSRRSPELEHGRRQADVNDWHGAIRTWESGIHNANRKNAGRLCYNIAIAYEVLGDFDTGMQWARRAYVDYGNRKARSYYRTLENRKRQEELIQMQLK